MAQSFLPGIHSELNGSIKPSMEACSKCLLLNIAEKNGLIFFSYFDLIRPYFWYSGAVHVGLAKNNFGNQQQSQILQISHNILVFMVLVTFLS